MICSRTLGGLFLIPVLDADFNSVILHVLTRGVLCYLLFGLYLLSHYSLK